MVVAAMMNDNHSIIGPSGSQCPCQFVLPVGSDVVAIRMPTQKRRSTMVRNLAGSFRQSFDMDAIGVLRAVVQRCSAYWISILRL
jgi:hypothetical protein